MKKTWSKDLMGTEHLALGLIIWVCGLVSIVFGLLPDCLKMEFMNLYGDPFVSYSSYVDSILVGYGHFSPMLTFILMVLIWVISTIYLFTGKASKALLFLSPSCFILNLVYPCLHGFSWQCIAISILQGIILVLVAYIRIYISYRNSKRTA